MQIHNHQRSIALTAAGMLLAGVAFAAADKTGCAASPLSLTVSVAHPEHVDSVKQVARIAYEHRICMGLEDTGEADHAASFDMRDIPIEQLLRRVFPGFLIEQNDSVISVRKPTRVSTWLDYKLKAFEIRRASLYFNSMQVFFFLKDQVAPQPGYIGSISEPINDDLVGPFAQKNSSIRELLNLLLSQSTKGGMWLVHQPYPRSEPLPQAGPFWTMIPFGASAEDALGRIDQRATQ